MKNHSHLKSDLDHAINASKNNNILAWTIEHLQADERNVGIAHDIRKRNIVKAELLEYPLELLRRVQGPQNGEKEPEPIHVWVERVGKIEHAIINNYLPSPIIVTDFWGKLEIADGNHRHEALLKQGFSKYWTIFILMHAESSKEVFLIS